MGQVDLLGSIQLLTGVTDPGYHTALSFWERWKGCAERALMKDHPLLRKLTTPLRQLFFGLFFETTLHVQCKSIPP